MKHSEYKAYGWLLHQGYKEEDIEFNSTWVFDFKVPGGFVEAKTIEANINVRLSRRQAFAENIDEVRFVCFTKEAMVPSFVGSLKELTEKYNVTIDGYCRQHLIVADIPQNWLPRLEQLAKENDCSIRDVIADLIVESIKQGEHFAN